MPVGLAIFWLGGAIGVRQFVKVARFAGKKLISD